MKTFWILFVVLIAAVIAMGCGAKKQSRVLRPIDYRIIEVCGKPPGYWERVNANLASDGGAQRLNNAWRRCKQAATLQWYEEIAAQKREETTKKVEVKEQ